MKDTKLRQRIVQGLNDHTAIQGRQVAINFIRPKTKILREVHDGLSEHVRRIKEYSLENNTTLTDQTVKIMQKNGFHVYQAADAGEALDYICGIVDEGPLIKSKTNAGKEIGLRQALESKGIEAVETDLGDRLCQLSGTKPSHPLAPAVHLPVELIAEIISRESGSTLPPQPEALVDAARRSLRVKLLTARVGISGANAISADTGSIILTENEGNIRAVTSLPPKHVVIAGIEKIVPTLDDAFNVVKATAIYGGAMEIGTYISVISGLGRDAGRGFGMPESGFGPREVHVVLLDNGRRKALCSGFAEALYCLNCGACLNHCPVYSEIGENYGSKHLGGRGVVFAAFNEGLESAVDSGLSLCINCRSCVEVCPVKINTPDLINRVRELAYQTCKPSALKRFVLKDITDKQRAGLAYSIGKNIQQFLFKREKGEGQKLRLSPKTWQNRVFPRLAARPFLDDLPQVNFNHIPRQRVAFFAGCLINYCYPEIGQAVINLLQSNGVDTVVPRTQGCCGIPLIVNGDLDKARHQACANIKSLSRLNVQRIITCCPTCGGALKEEYPRLLENEPNIDWQLIDWLSKNVQDISEFLMEELPQFNFNHRIDARVTYHDSCHLLRRMGVRKPPRELINRLPGVRFVEMEEPDSCCGCGGSFSFEHYTLSGKINDRKFKNVEDTRADILVAGCPACIAHLRDGVSRNHGRQQVLHLVQLLELASSQGREGHRR